VTPCDDDHINVCPNGCVIWHEEDLDSVVCYDAMVKDECATHEGAVYVATEFGTCLHPEDIITGEACRKVDYHCDSCYVFNGTMARKDGENLETFGTHILTCV
jgi:hypothetical protein